MKKSIPLFETFAMAVDGDINYYNNERIQENKMDASYKIQRGIHVHLIQFFMCPEFWVHIMTRIPV